MQEPATSAATDLTWLYWFLAIVAFVVFAVVFYVLRKGRRFPGEHVFRASRWSRQNRLFPAQVVISPTSLTLYKPQWIGKVEESIHMAHVASIKINTHLLFSDIFVETSGGQAPVICHGHTKGDAVKMKQLIERFQSEYYRGSGEANAARDPNPTNPANPANPANPTNPTNPTNLPNPPNRSIPPSRETPRRP